MKGLAMSSPLIVVPLDGSHDAEVVLPFAQELAAALPADLRLLHVLPPSEMGNDTLGRENLAFYMARLDARCGLSAAQWLPPVTAGHPADAIIEALAGASLLAIASHGRGGFRAATIGSVADRVIRETPVPALFVPVTADAVPLAGRPVVAGLDTSEPSIHALTFARSVAAALGSPVHLAEAYSVSALLRGAAVGIDLLGIVRQNVEEYLGAATLPGETFAARRGAAHQILLEEADRLDAAMIAVGTQGEGRTTRLLLGSTTDRLMHTSRRPLLIVPSPHTATA